MYSVFYVIVISYFKYLIII